MMLTSNLSIVEYERGRARPDRLTRVTHRHYLEYAGRLLELYRGGVGKTRRELHRAVEGVFAGEEDCDRRRIGAFAKLLDDASTFDEDRRGKASALRLKVFGIAAKYHPLVTEPQHVFERTAEEAKRAIAAEIGRPWDEVERGLYIDVPDAQPLISFEGYESPEALLSRYNLAQLQACLYRARKMEVLVTGDFAAIVRWAKLARLLVECRRVGEMKYRIELSGPSAVLVETRRYGVNFARLVGALVACRGWSMHASVATPWGNWATLAVSCEDGYRSHVPRPEEFDSEVESALAEKWGESREGWRLMREAGILQEGQATFVPDFLLKHEDGREAFLEIVGFWTPEYLQAKRKTVALFRDRRIVLAVAKSVAKEGAQGPGVLTYRTRVKPEEVVRAVEGLFGGDE